MIILDLFCCEGGASVGYHRAGWEVYGVDLFQQFKQKRYPFPSVKVDALWALDSLLRGHALVMDNGKRLYLSDIDAFSASPPCQIYSITNAARRATYPALIEPVRKLLQRTGKPYIIENVPRAPLNNPTVLCGTMFNLTTIDDDGTPLQMYRHRLFETNFTLTAPPHSHDTSIQVAGSYGGARRDKHEARNVRHGGYVPSKQRQQELLGIDWMTVKGMHQSIPPAYTEHIGRQLLLDTAPVSC